MKQARNYINDKDRLIQHKEFVHEKFIVEYIKQAQKDAIKSTLLHLIGNEQLNGNAFEIEERLHKEFNLL